MNKVCSATIYYKIVIFYMSYEVAADLFIFNYIGFRNYFCSLAFNLLVLILLIGSRSSFLKPHFLAHILFKGWCTWDQVLDFDGTLACRATC